MAGHSPSTLPLSGDECEEEPVLPLDPRTAKITLMYVVVVPSIIGYLAYKTDGLWDLRAKRRGDTIYER
ncbi:unnamed protein product [Parascedosporium putredinis]|uniref:Uncharacterized protein n=1 Tax=Parascedosporium putredinis TaxID=1442378 RepID=A0A9P1H6B3_9PEZI|nr:unnamed protein product [Parascedosporium putredinis]CAI8000074.1 unnamed protein product [Parascedosporium putredinis]